MTKLEKQLRERIKFLEEELLKVKAERQLFRDWMVADLKQQIDLLGRSKYWSPNTWIERIAKRFQNLEWWHWS